MKLVLALEILIDKWLWPTISLIHHKILSGNFFWSVNYTKNAWTEWSQNLLSLLIKSYICSIFYFHAMTTSYQVKAWVILVLRSDIHGFVNTVLKLKLINKQIPEADGLISAYIQAQCSSLPPLPTSYVEKAFYTKVSRWDLC